MNTGKKIQQFVNVPGTRLNYPETVIFGAHDGKCVTVSAGVHCREYVGIQAVIELARTIDPKDIYGELHLVHAFNYDGLICRCSDVFRPTGKPQSRFPGSTCGTDAEKLAAFLEETVIRHSDCIVDLHSGAAMNILRRTSIFTARQLRRSARNRRSLRCMWAFRTPCARRRKRVYSHAGTCGVPAVLIERGCCGLWSEDESSRDIEDVKNILRFLGVLRDGIPSVRKNPRIFDRGEYSDAPVSGCWYPAKAVGERIKAGESLGRICDIFGELLHEEFAKHDGIILYQTASLGIEKDCPMVAYAIEER